MSSVVEFAGTVPGYAVIPFRLVRREDVSGVSGTGVIAYGFELHDGQVVMKWVTEYSSVAVYASMADVVAIHGHNGLTEVVYS